MKVINVELSKIIENKDQPRKKFDKEKLESLKNSILISGLIHPISVMETDSTDGNEKYMIVAGARRYRAIKAIVDESNEYPNNENLQNRAKEFEEGILSIVITENHEKLSLIENIQREDLNYLELAECLKKIKDNDGELSELDNNDKKTLDELSKITGKSVSRISEILSINNLLDEIRTEAINLPNAPLWILIEVAKQKSDEEQKELWNRLKDGNITVVEYRNEKKNTNSNKVTIKKIDKIFSTTITQMENISVTNWNSIQNDDKKNISEKIADIRKYLEKIEDKLNATDQTKLSENHEQSDNI